MISQEMHALFSYRHGNCHCALVLVAEYAEEGATCVTSHPSFAPPRAEGCWRRILYINVYILFSYIISLNTGEFLEEQRSKWSAVRGHGERSESGALTVSHREFVLYSDGYSRLLQLAWSKPEYIKYIPV